MYLCFSWNARGLKNALKRQSIFYYIPYFYPSLVCLQETHGTNDTTRFLQCRFVQEAYYLTYTSHSKGVSILAYMDRSPALVDKNGKYIFLQCKLYDLKLIFAGVYMPPPTTPQIVSFAGASLSTWVPILVLGDFNNVIDLGCDWFPSHGSLLDESPCSLCRLRKDLRLQDMYEVVSPWWMCLYVLYCISQFFVQNWFGFVYCRACPDLYRGQHRTLTNIWSFPFAIYLNIWVSRIEYFIVF